MRTDRRDRHRRPLAVAATRVSGPKKDSYQWSWVPDRLGTARDAAQAHFGDLTRDQTWPPEASVQVAHVRQQEVDQRVALVLRPAVASAGLTRRALPENRHSSGTRTGGLRPPATITRM